MQDLTHKAYNVIQQVLRKGSIQVKYAGIWRTLHIEEGIGVAEGRKLCLTGKDRERLRTMVLHAVGADPMFDEIGGDRIEVAGQVKDEKWSTKTVFDKEVRVTRTGKAVRTRFGNIGTPGGISINVPYDAICFEPGDTVVIVENGAAFRYWADYRVPNQIKDAVVVYRGHDVSMRHVMEMLKALPSHVQKVGFFDLDPAGLNIAMNLGVETVLIPDDPIFLIQDKKNMQERFAAQLAAAANLESRLPPDWLELWGWMKTHQVSISQESMLASDCQLRLLLSHSDVSPIKHDE
jgi:hypothetical protein